MLRLHATLFAAMTATQSAVFASSVGAQATSRDSAGVRIVEYASVREGPVAFTVDSLPALRFGGPQDDPARELTSTHPFLSVTALRDGRWALVDADHVKLFDRSGRYVKSFGRSGSGPGEFRQLLRICRLRADTLLAINYNDRRVSLWTDKGTLIRGFAALPGLGMDPCLGDGTLLVSRARPGRENSAATAVLIRVGPDGAVRNELGEVPTEDFFRPLPRSVSVLARDDQVIFGENTTFEVRAVHVSGRLRRVLRVRGGRDPMSREVWDNGLRRLPPQFRARFEGQSRPEFMPAFGELESDEQGRLWVRDYADRALWTVFDKDWELLGKVRLPEFSKEPAELIGFSGELLILRYKDADGFTLLGLHRLAPAHR